MATQFPTHAKNVSCTSFPQDQNMYIHTNIQPPPPSPFGLVSICVQIFWCIEMRGQTEDLFKKGLNSRTNPMQNNALLLSFALALVYISDKSELINSDIFTHYFTVPVARFFGAYPILNSYT